MAALTASCLCAAEQVPPPAPDTIQKLPVTTGWLGNSLLRGGQADWKDKSQTFLQLYTSDLAVTGDGRIYCTTTWEEGGRAAGIYKDGDALEDIPGFGLDSGSSVAVTDKLMAYGRKGKIGTFTRGKDGKHEVASGRQITFDDTPKAPNVTGVCLDEAKDIVYAGDESGVIRSFQFSSGKAINAAGFAAPRVGQMRLDAAGNRVVLPYDVNLQDAKGDQGYVATTAGDYVFVGYEQRMTVLVYKAATLELVGRIDIGPQSQTPIFDGPPELIVSQRGAVYELFLPQYTGNATTVVAWNPSDPAPLPAPSQLTVLRNNASNTVSWTASAEATNYRIQRRVIGPDGWSSWNDQVELPATLVTWTDPAPPTRTSAYRLQAHGSESRRSDWSKTAYAR